MNANVDNVSVVVCWNDGVHVGDHCTNDAAHREQNQTSSQGSIERLLVLGQTPLPRSSPHHA
jgi:predicted heme/steroid binding protein